MMYVCYRSQGGATPSRRGSSSTDPKDPLEEDEGGLHQCELRGASSMYRRFQWSTDEGGSCRVRYGDDDDDDMVMMMMIW